MKLPNEGDRIRFNRWDAYTADAPPPPEEWTGEVLEVWGICRTFLRVRRDHDGRKVILFPPDIEEVTMRFAVLPRSSFAAAAQGLIPAGEVVQKKQPKGRSRKR